MATRVGNAFSATGRRIAQRYGLDLRVCWGPFIAVLPEDPYRRLNDQAGVVLARTQAVLWAVAATVLALLAGSVLGSLLWIAGSLTVAGLAYRALRAAVATYCDIVEDTVVTHRLYLYRALGITPPGTDTEEHNCGEALSRYLWRLPGAVVQLSWTERP